MQRAALLLAFLVATVEVLACAVAPPRGERIDVVEESAVIVWDPATQTEHFIRRATFQGNARDFGFLVPTPAQPTLAGVPDGIFETMEDKTARQTDYKTRKTIDWTPLVFGFFLLKSETAPIVTAAAPVNVLATQKVAGYDATVLDATDAKALRTWLEEHGYATSPDLVEWLEPYIRQRWTITAFKIDKSQPETAARTSAVKMSFQTEQPFFPYREPSTAGFQPAPVPPGPAGSRRYSGPARSLRVFFLGPERVRGTIGATTSWPAALKWSDRIDDAFRTYLANATGVTVAAGTRLSRFDDLSTPRPGIDDLFFSRDQDQRPVVPPPYVFETIEKTRVPGDLVLITIVVGALLIWGFRRRRRVAACVLFAILTAVTGSAADRFTAIFFDDGQTILQTGSELTLFSLDPKKVPLFSRVRGKSPKETFHGYPVLSSVKLTGETKDKLLGRLYTAIAAPASPARCFVPRHGIRAKSSDKQIDLVICFECQQLESHVAGRKGGGLISPSAQPTFDELLKR